MAGGRGRGQCGRGSGRGRIRGGNTSASENITRGRGRGKGRGGTTSARESNSTDELGNKVRGNSSRKSAKENISALKPLPKALSVFSNNWVEITETTPYDVVLKDEYDNLENGNIISGMYLNMATRVVTSICRKGLDVTSPNIFSHLISDRAILMIIEHTTH